MNDALSKEQWISFHINGATYVQPIEQVREIVPYREPAPVPGAPAEVEGIVNIRGDVISVISARHLMDAPSYLANDDSRILIIEHEQNLIGFTVDSVSEIVGFNSDQIEHGYADHDLIKGTVKIESELYIVADLANYTNNKDAYE